MPIYEYRCNDCGHEFETIQKISESPLQTCPACEHDALVKKISAVGFRLKGSGWYETDFKSGNKRNVSSGDSTPRDGSAGSSDGNGSGGDGSSKDSSGKDSSGKDSSGKDSSGKDSSSGATSESAKTTAATGSSKSKNSGESKSSKADSSP